MKGKVSKILVNLAENPKNSIFVRQLFQCALFQFHSQIKLMTEGCQKLENSLYV